MRDTPISQAREGRSEVWSASQRPVRALFVNTRSAIGADVAVHLTLIQNLGASCCEVTIATNNRAVDIERMREILKRVPNLRVVEMNLGYELAGQGKAQKIRGALGNVGALLFGLARLSFLVWRRRVDIIHSTDRPRDALVSTLLARLTRRKNVLHMHIKWFGGMGRATNWAVQKCDAVLAISDFVRRSLVEGGIPEQKVHTALNAIDPENFDPSKRERGALRARHNLASDAPVIGIVARIMVWKGHMELIEALAKVKRKHPGVRLAIVGKEDLLAGNSADSYTEALKRRIEELGLTENVIWAGWYDDMAPIFADMDVVCVPSREEPFGLVVTEAMAMEKAVIGSTGGALPEIIRDGAEGFLVPALDTDAWAEAIIKLLDDPALRERVGKAARQRVLRQFVPRRQADEVAAIYRRICGLSDERPDRVTNGKG